MKPKTLRVSDFFILLFVLFVGLTPFINAGITFDDIKSIFDDTAFVDDQDQDQDQDQGQVNPPVTDQDDDQDGTKTNITDLLADPKSGYSQLNDNEKKAYDQIVWQIENLNEHTSLIGLNITRDQYQKIRWFIEKDHPEFFYMSKQSSVYSGFNQTISAVDIPFNMPKEEIKNKQALIENWKNEVFSRITPDMDNLQKVKVVHDYLVDEVTYDLSAPNTDNLLSVAENKRTVCEGYSEAFQYLLNQLGIFATGVCGNANGGLHEWNLVNLNGEYSWFDVTWDDPSYGWSSTEEGYHTYEYYGTSTEDLTKTHEIDQQYEQFDNYPTPSYNYYYTSGRYFDLNDPNAMTDLKQKLNAAKANGEANFEVRFANNDQMNQALSDWSLILSSFSYTKDDQKPILNFYFK